MNETYPNISERRAAFFGHSAAGYQPGAAREAGEKARAREVEGHRRCCCRVAPDCPFEQQGHWNVLVYELSATVIHLAAHVVHR